MSVVQQVTHLFNEHKDLFYHSDFIDIVFNSIEQIRNYIIIESILKRKEIISTISYQKREEFIFSEELSWSTNASSECYSDYENEDWDNKRQRKEEESDKLIESFKCLINDCNRDKEKIKQLYYAMEKYYRSNTTWEKELIVLL